MPPRMRSFASASTSSSGPPTPLGAQSTGSIGERVAALQDELRETKRRLKAGAGAGLPKPGELAAAAQEVAPGVRLASRPPAPTTRWTRSRPRPAT